MNPPSTAETTVRRAILVTGAGGFIGRRLVQRLIELTDRPIIALMRRPESIRTGHVETVVGDLRELDKLSHRLSEVATVVHLAAAVGRHSQNHFFDVNERATRELLKHCRLEDVQHFIFVSTIAAKFQNLHEYPYAQSKLAAEHAVESSQVPFTIVRPTIVMGDGGASWQSLASLARLPWIPRVGSGQARVQPIDVDDLVEALARLALSDTPLHSIWELGGPEVISIDSFLRAIRTEVSGAPYRTIAIPLSLLRAVLYLAESMLGRYCPVARGQFSIFHQDSSAAATPNHVPAWTAKQSVASMIARAVRGNSTKTAFAPPQTSLSSPDGTPVRVGDHGEKWQRECVALTRYLLGIDPPVEVLDAYLRAHAHGVIGATQESINAQDAIDRAITSKWRMTCLDAYCRWFSPCHRWRQKLVLLLAILENHPTTYAAFQLPKQRNSVWIAASIGWRLMGSIGLALVWRMAWSIGSILSRRPLTASARND